MSYTNARRNVRCGSLGNSVAEYISHSLSDPELVAALIEAHGRSRRYADNEVIELVGGEVNAIVALEEVPPEVIPLLRFISDSIQRSLGKRPSWDDPGNPLYELVVSEVAESGQAPVN
jgi:hypothetical protein